MGSIGPGVLTVVGLMVGLALVAVLVSKSANTSSVISTTGSSLAGVISAAVSPVTGQTSFNFGSNANNIGGVTS
jgi:hypothetical protein